jgi:xanthine dehydrogenase accessory protein XdhC
LERFTAADLPLLQAAAHAAQTSATAMLESDFDGIRVTRWLIDASSPESMRLLKSIAASHEHDHPARQRNVVRSIRQSVEAPNQSAAQDTASADNETGSFPNLQFTPNSAHTGILLERLSSPKQALWVFGAGHVGQAIVRALSDLPFDITWVDSRASYLPTSLPANVRSVCESQPTETLAEAPKDAMYIVLTHDHAMDYSLCHAILQRGAFAWLGLIGSESKGARFRSRLRKDGIAPERIAKLVCPIGVEGIESKSPAAIAIGVAAQLLQWTSASAEATVPASHGPLPASVTQIKVRSESAAQSSSATDCGESCDGCSNANSSSS